MKSCVRHLFKDKTIKELAEIAEIRPEHLSKYINGKANITFEKGLDFANKWDIRERYLIEFRQTMMSTINFQYLDTRH